MHISLISTPFDHFHFRPPLGLLSSQDLTACPKNTHFCGHGPKLIQFQNLKLKIIFIEAKKRPNLSNLSHHNWPE